MALIKHKGGEKLSEKYKKCKLFDKKPQIYESAFSVLVPVREKAIFVEGLQIFLCVFLLKVYHYE